MSTIIREIFLVRHGETDFNKAGIVQGRGVNSSINENGRLQAQKFFEHFKHMPFNTLLTSTLQRTQQTLQPFAEAGYDLKAHEELDEINWGIHEGKITTYESRNDYHELITQWKSGNVHVRIQDGESPLELQQRQLKFINEILPGYEGKILICSHGRAIRSMLCTMLDKPLSEMDTFPHNNLSLYKLNQKREGFELDWFNYTEHLK
jgi:probable phosphoglycerate mutase